MASDAALQEGMRALEEARWSDARHAFAIALRDGETPEVLEGMGMAAWWLNDAVVVFDARERAYASYRERGDRRDAARVAIALAEDCLYFRGEPAVARGWHERATALLDDVEPCAELGWLAISIGDHALTLREDPSVVTEHASRAIEIARALALPDLETVARALEGAALVAEGRIDDGMRRLDGSVAAALAGEVSQRVAVVYACCYLMSACNRARDLDRAAQWCERVAAYSRRIGSDALLGLCRLQHAEVLIARGEWEHAERELDEASKVAATARPAMQAEPVVRLARLRRYQGRLDEARALLDQIEGHPLVPLERASLALDGGDALAAAEIAERFLRRVIPTQRLDRCDGLDVLLRARAMVGDRDGTAAALAQLQASAQGDRTPALRGAMRQGAPGPPHRGSTRSTADRERLEQA